VLIWTWIFPTSALMTLTKRYSAFPICQYPCVLSIPVHKTGAHSGTSACQRRALFYVRQRQLPYYKLENRGPRLKGDFNKISATNIFPGLKIKVCWSAFTPYKLFVFSLMR